MLYIEKNKKNKKKMKVNGWKCVFSFCLYVCVYTYG